ncbi:WGR domain-containing protein [Tenacibaculum finnmarkense]|uniref:WGR domain-containing protein n=1 Tax=Tenacibaculum finnmarkense TaxID=2781243 RepID=UPI001E49F73C|nr:WGR domain-containing protein [Tenacibaculum finnmarkense]MCD8400264.1 WGR domain-containing protein [Tenacibaculum finnmarkense genomovar ulcerans]MCG8785755.1 WGR domain-containing protein [Tenacibaculum finnmarkense]MCG8795758.1 WGR domain-containing protein [Tenacibaculum finnmarkense]MCG8797880.1 WGR domain-containing protein [Tenacibaculum finnmarkense]MCG8813112.1 WGR domain-containing protein [Tenacibaculum finnmarkense]
MMYDCEWDSKLSLEKILEQGRLLSEERKKTGIRRFVQRKKGFSDGYYDVKFWEIFNTGLEIKTQYGRVDTSSSRKNTKKHINKEASEKDFEKKIKVKLKNGYQEET